MINEFDPEYLLGPIIFSALLFIVFAISVIGIVINVDGVVLNGELNVNG